MADLAVTGSTGALGGRVAKAFADLGIEQRLIVRSAERAPSLDGAEVREVPGGYADPAGFRAALEGVGTLFLVSAEEAPDRVAQHKQAIRETGVAFTFLRDSFYMDFIPYFAGPERTFRGPAADGRLAPVSRDDVAAVAVAVLSAPGSHDGNAYGLTGPELFTLTEAAARMSTYTGEPYSYVVETTEEAWASRRPTGAPDWMIEGWISTYVAIADGSLDQVSGAVEAVTGRAPQTLEQTLDAHPELLEA
jgi:NAD(P)H dehydrogenase (quinone)